MRTFTAVRSGAGLALFLVLVGLNLSHASAQGTASITIHNRICPVEYSGDDIFGDCHGNPQDSNLEFTIDGPSTATAATDDEGNVTFANLAAGTYNISGGVPGDFASTVVWCSINEDPDTLFQPTETDTGVSVEVADGENIICDWYNIPFDLSGGTPTPAPTATPGGGVTQLPGTGTGSESDSIANLALYGLAFLALGMTAIAVRRRVTR